MKIDGINAKDAIMNAEVLLKSIISPIRIWDLIKGTKSALIVDWELLTLISKGVN